MSVPEPMTDEQFRAEMDLVTSAARMLMFADVDRLLWVVQQAGTLGPLLNPTAYLRGGADNLRDQAELLDAVAVLQKAMARIRDRAVAKEAGGG